jgi:hypothetical protein
MFVLLSREETVFDAAACAGMDNAAMLWTERSGWTCGRGKRDARMGGSGLVLAFWMARNLGFRDGRVLVRD